MQQKSSLTTLAPLILLILPVLALCQTAPENRTLVINGQPGQVNVVQMNGRSYVDVEALARVANGSLAFQGNQITLTLPGGANVPSTAAPPASPPADPGLSSGFLKAGIEAMSVVREWHSALANAIKNGFPIAEGWLAGYRSQARTALRLASAATSTDSDRNAFQLMTNAFNFMDKLSNEYLADRQSMNYISPDALASDPLDQKLLSCGHSLASMVASRQFVDDGSCQ